MATKAVKAEILAQWANLPDNVDLYDAVTPIAYKSAGSKYGADGIRISGSPQFIDAVLGKLKDLLVAENGSTRLSLSRAVVESPEINGQRKQFDYAGGEVCYIQVHQRGTDSVAGIDPEVRKNDAVLLRRSPARKQDAIRGEYEYARMVGFDHDAAAARATERVDRYISQNA